MDLRALNPKVYDMWRIRKDAGPDYFSDSSEQEVAAIETEVGSPLPDDYREFLLTYSTVAAVPKIGANFFRCAFPDRDVITFDFVLVPSAASTLSAIRALHNPHPHFETVGRRVPKSLLPLSLSGYATLLIDLRPEGFGRILYLNGMKKQTFGTEGYGWKNIGFVADSFTAFLKDLDTREVQEAKYGLPVIS